MNKVVARLTDGTTHKGLTSDFSPMKDVFHLIEANAAPGDPPLTVRIPQMKALFFVKDLIGDPDYVEKKEFDDSCPLEGRPIKVVFKDGEVLVGTTTGYNPSRPGLFLTPADPGSNIERCYIVAASTQEVSWA